MELSEYITLHRHFAEAICQRMTEEINKQGFPPDDVEHYPNYDEARFDLVKDPYSGMENLTCYWFIKQQRIGRLQFNSDGSFYAEYDVVRPHPTKSNWFVEAITAWGQTDNIKAEAKLLPMPK